MMLEPWFAALLLVTAATRIVELAISRRNLTVLRARAVRNGAIVRDCESRAAYSGMVALHVSLLVLPAIESAGFARVTPWQVFVPAVALWSAGQALRWASVRALGSSWNARGATASDQVIVHEGVYRHLRHPNYLGVILEAIAIPLAGSAWFSLGALVPTVILVTWRRLRAEEQLLAELPDWQASFHDVNRLIPHFR